MELRQIALLLYLLICSIEDIRFKKVSVWLLIIGSIGGLLCIILRMIHNDAYISDILLGLSPGIIMILFSIKTKERLGLADGIIAVIIALVEDGNACILVCIVALFIVAITSIILVALRKANKSSTIPFVPFMALGYVVICTMFI